MIALQEELDWEVYRLYGLIDEDLTYSGDDLPGLALGERAFEIALARAVASGEEETAWFDAAWVHSDHRDSRALACRVSRARAAAAGPDRVDPFYPVAGEAGVQAAVGAGAVGEAAGAGAAGLAAGPAGGPAVLVRPQGRPRPRSIAQLADEVARDADLSVGAGAVGGASRCAGDRSR